ncbi:Methyltransferase small domain-containing protein [Methylophilus rhizosphaerae]|uniref:Methyltransferase small domain-containing protein n=1 Tax=Methylophilus rhizosphaerae TaxID=492660 RepID=A0A1G9DXA5_9PROT|nr:class I SAM-dependent methyltransferase [Methylophilus rhizosphaerae]SDK68517.1 Methyltransferase small domain-containing protein [Methylophilus rhizosphaerae]
MEKHLPASLEKLLRALRDREYRFVTTTPATHQLVNQRAGNAWARHLRDVFGWNRPFMPETVDAALFALMQEAGILRPLAQGWQSLVRVSSLQDKLFLHSGFPTDTADAVFFGPDTYRFINALYSSLSSLPGKVQRCVDIGTGTGAGAIFLAEALPYAESIGVDINPQALSFAAINAQANDLPTARFQYSDLLHDLPGEFDLIVANPPYLVDPSARAYRHGKGPLGAQLSLDIVESALTRLAPGGSLMLYTGVAIMEGHDPFLEAVKHKTAPAGCTYQYTELEPDIFGEELITPAYANADRIAAVWLVVNRPTVAGDTLLQLISKP